MITTNSDDIAKQLLDLQARIEQKLTKMVLGFSYQFSMRAIANTPIGDSRVFASWYKNRQYGLPEEEGIAKGNWQFSTNDNFQLQIVSGHDAGAQALDLMSNHYLSYALGQTVYIGNAAPYISMLEKNHSPQTNKMGIMTPTMNDIKGAYAIDLKALYDKG